MITKIMENTTDMILITPEMLKNIKPGDVLIYAGKCNAPGQLLRVRVNGQPKTWKTRPNEVRVPYKCGLYESGYITQADLRNEIWYKEVQ